MLENIENNYETSSEVPEINRSRKKRKKISYKFALLKSMNRKIGSYQDLDLSNHPEPQARIAKFGMLLARKKAK